MNKKTVKQKVTLESLAAMVAKGFEGVHAVMVTKDDLSNELAEIKQDLEEIKLKFDHVAYKFEVKDLQRRVGQLERKIGVK